MPPPPLPNPNRLEIRDAAEPLTAAQHADWGKLTVKWSDLRQSVAFTTGILYDDPVRRGGGLPRGRCR